MKEIQLGPGNNIHDRIPWPCKEWKVSCPITLPSGFISHLEHNQSISFSDHTSVKEFKQKLSEEIQIAEGNIQKRGRGFKQLQVVNDVRKKKQFACDVILSTFRRLSDNILYEIASHCRPEPHSEIETTTRKQRAYHLPSILSQTSKSWRSTARNTPSLWNCITVETFGWNELTIPILQSHLARCARLSKSLPLTIQLVDCIRDDWETRNLPNNGRGLQWLLVEWLRKDWKDRHRITSLIVHPYDISDVFLAFSAHMFHESPLPSVTSFLMMGGHHPKMDRVQPLGDILLTGVWDMFPNLQRFWFDRQRNVFDDLGRDAFLAPLEYFGGQMLSGLSGLTTIYINQIIYYDNWMSLLKRCPLLERGGFELADIFAGHHETLTSAVAFPRMKEMILGYYDPDMPVYVMEPFLSLRFPNLATLHVRLHPLVELHDCQFLYHSRTEYAKAEKFVHTFPSLQSLVIETVENDAEDLTQIPGIYTLIKCLPSTKSISVTSCSSENFVDLMKFILLENAQNRLPSLETVYIAVGLDKTPIEMRGMPDVFYLMKFQLRPTRASTSTRTHLNKQELLSDASHLNYRILLRGAVEAHQSICDEYDLEMTAWVVESTSQDGTLWVTDTGSQSNMVSWMESNFQHTS